MKLDESSIDVNGSSVNVAEGPADGPPLLFLHGVLRRWQDFLPLLPALSVHRQPVALDFRGHGRSGPRPNRYRVFDYVEDVLALLPHARQPWVIYGHSLGAMVALAAAASPLADHCRALVLEDPPFETMGALIRQTPFHSQFSGMRPLAGSPRPVAEVANELAKVIVKMPDGTDLPLGQLRDAASLRFSARCLKDVDPEVFAPILAGEWLQEYDLGEIIAGVRCPVLLLEADAHAGGMLREEDADRLELELPDCTRVRFPGAGHLLHWTNTGAVLRAVTAFLESLE